MRNFIQPGDSLAVAVPYAGGVTSGIDFGLTVVAALTSRAEAETIQLALEYAPAPPFRSESLPLSGLRWFAATSPWRW